jgi:PD-(D/E)XK nuclease superfamily
MKKFQFSWSRLKNFRTCPKRHFHVDIEKDFQEAKSEALLWGNEVHDALAKRIDKKTALPRTMAQYEDWPARILKLRDAGLAVKVENKLAMNDKFAPTGFFDASTWFRAVIDVLVLAEESGTAISIDWKTGNKVQPEFEQLALSAQLIFAHYPEIDQVGAIYVWLGHDTESVKAYRRDAMLPVWNDIWPLIKLMEEAHRTTTYPPKPSGLCVHYCPVTSCPYHGKGSR